MDNVMELFSWLCIMGIRSYSENSIILGYVYSNYGYFYVVRRLLMI